MQHGEKGMAYTIDDYTRYTTVFPLRIKGEVSAVLIPWIRTVRLQLREWFGQDLPVLRLHSDRGGEFSSDLLRDFCHGEGITKSVTLPDSPQQNGIAERRIGLVMEVARTSMIHAAAPHFMWPFATSLTLRWTGTVGDALVFRVWGSCAFVRDTSADKLSARAIPCGFLGFVPDAPVGEPTEPGAAGAGGTGASVAGVGGPGTGGAGAAGAGAVDPGAGGAGGTVRPRPYFVPLLQQVLGVPSSTGLPPPFLCPPPDQSQPPLQPASPLLVPSPHTEQSGGLTKRREPASRPASLVRTARRAPRSRPPPVPGTHTMAPRPSSVPQRVPLPAPPESSLPEVPNPESDHARAASPTVACLLAAVVTDPSFESSAASALVAELLDFAAACRLDYASALVAESVPASPPSVGDLDAPDILTPRSYTEAITGPYSSQWQAAMDAEMASWKSTGPYVDAVPLSRAKIVDGMWIFRVKRPPGSLPAFNTAFLQSSLHEEIWLRCPPGFTGSFPAGTQWSLRRPVHGLRQAPREWHDTLRTTLAALGFAPSTADSLLYLRTDTLLPPFYVLVSFSASASSSPLSTNQSLSAPPSDESVEPSGPYPELVGCLITSGMGLVLGGRGPVVLTGHADASWVDDSATQQLSQGYTFSLGSDSVSWRSTRSSSVLSSSCEAEIYAGAVAAQELRWLTYLPTDLGEQPRLPPVLYVDNKAMIALCQEHRLEHRTKHIALRYFLARELQQRGQLCLAYVATRVNTADVFTKFDTWLDNLQLYLLSDYKDNVSLSDHTSDVAPAPPTTADSATRSQWLTLDAAVCLSICYHLPLAECAHFGQHRTAHALYGAVVARYSSPATAALGRLLLPYLFPELSAFATVQDLVSHLCTSVARYRAALPAEFFDKNPPPMDHFLALDPTALTVDLLEKHLFAAETTVVAVGAARGTPRTPFYEGCSPSPLAPSYASAAAVDVLGAEDVGAASASVKRCSSKGRGGRGGGGGSGGGGGGSSGGGGSGGGGSDGSGGGSGGLGGGGGGSGGSGGSGSGRSGGGRTGAQRGGSGGGQRQHQQRRSETPSPQQLREWFAQRGASGGSVSCPYVIRTGDRAGQTCGKPHIQQRCFSRLDVAWHTEFGDEAERPCCSEGDYHLCVPPDPGIEAAALGASESFLPGTAPAEALHTFILDSAASRCFFRVSTTLTPLSPPVPVRLADPSGGPALARSSTVLPCPAVPFGSLSGLHLPSFSTNLVSTTSLQDTMVTTTTPGGQVAPPCSCRLLSHQTLLWHQRLGHPYRPRLRGMHSHLLISGLPRSLPPLPTSPAPPCLPCIEGRQRAAPHYSSFPPTTAPLQTLHMDVVDVLIPEIRTVRLQLRERFGQDLPVLRLHSDRGGELSSDLLRDFCLGEGILQSFMLPDSPQQNGIAERRIGLVMEVARTSMIHAAAPHFQWPFAVRYVANQLNLWPCVSLPKTSPTLRWTGKVGDASVFRVWGSRGFVCDISADKLSARDIPCGPAPLGVSQVDPLPGAPPVEVAVGSGAARGAASGGAEPGGAEFEGAGSGGAEPGSAEPGGAEPAGVEPKGAELEGVEPGVVESESAESRVLSLGLLEWFAQRTRLRSGAAGARDSAAGDTGAGGARVTAGVGGSGGAAAAGPGGACTRGTRAAATGGVGGAGAIGNGAGGAGAFDHGAGGAGEPASPLLAPSPYTEQTGSLTERREPASRPASPVLPGRHVPRPHPPSVPGTHAMALTPSSVPLLPLSLVSSPLLSLTATVESSAVSTLVAEPVDFAAGYRLDYATDLVADSGSARPLSIGGECALGTDVLEDRQEEFECLAAAVPRFASMLLAPEGDPDAPDIPTPRSYVEAITGPYSSQWLAAMDAEMASWKSTGPYVDAVPPSRAKVVDGMWIFRVKRLPGSSPAFKARYVARGFNPSLFLCTETSLPPFYVLVYVDDLVFATADTEALTLVKSELQKRHTCTDLVEVLQRFGFQFSSPQPTPLSTSHSLSAPPSDESVEPSGLYLELVGCLITSNMGLVLGGRGPVVLTGHADGSWVNDSATQRSSQGYTFSLGSGSFSWQSTRSSSVLSSSCEAEIYVGAMAAQELRWLTYLLTDLGEQPRSPSILYVDNKATIALCQEH
ncbi:unnamed protein product [Closterium sp. NIES-54]